MSLGHEETWECVYCTYKNHTSTEPRCEICKRLRPRSGRSKVDERCDSNELSCPAKKRMRPSVKSKKKLFHQAEQSTTPIKQTPTTCTPLSENSDVNAKGHTRTAPSVEKSFINSDSGDKIEAREVNHQMQTEVEKCKHMRNELELCEKNAICI